MTDFVLKAVFGQRDGGGLTHAGGARQLTARSLVLLRRAGATSTCTRARHERHTAMSRASCLLLHCSLVSCEQGGLRSLPKRNYERNFPLRHQGP